MLRFGLCCLFAQEPIKFSVTTASALKRLSRTEAELKLSSIAMKNALALRRAITYCHQQGIGAFRINSQLLPLKTHPEFGYRLEDLPDGKDIISAFKEVGVLVRTLKIRTLFHPDQFILLSSPSEEVTRRSINDLEYHAQMSVWVGADVINIHAGGAYGDKPQALKRVAKRIASLPKLIKDRLTLENDDTTYTPSDLLPLCQETGIPLVYDVHHHRCLKDGLSVEQATSLALATWGKKEPVVHLSSPREGWQGPQPRKHHDYIDLSDFPLCWRGLKMTVEVEAKAKELAVRKLMQQLLR